MSIKTNTEAGVTTLTLADPASRNAITGEEMLEDILDILDEAEADPEVTVIVIDADGPAFSSGGNVKDMAAGVGLFAGSPAEITEKYRNTIQQLTRFLATTDLVTIASVNGPAVGAGFDLVLGCDLRFGSRNARFAHTFIEMGIIPGDGGAWLLPRVVGWQRATELALTARFITAAEAESYGVLLEVVPEEKLEERVSEFARTIASKPSPAVVLAKRLLRQARTMDLDGFLELSAALQAIAHTTPEHSSAVADYVDRLKSRD
ncbi:MAG TPA: enoyl-CoA hydratase-related protein [Acidimicrobiia bacterium]|nr:enoyl-CoA hydratase-related protein [Acidimicrobiia bacterium]